MEIIAELGQNHNGDMNLAIRMIHSAKDSGADAVKFQLYDARKLFPKKNNPWFKYNCQTELSKGQVYKLAEECKKSGIEFLASVFDLERIEWLKEIGVKRYKIASRSIYDQELIEQLCRTGKPLLVSLGIWQGKKFPKLKTSAPVDFLYCISKYPALLSEMKLADIDFNVYSGLSDHTLGISAAICALARGARIVEKHFTLDKGMYGPDHSASMIPEELKALHSFRQDLKELIKYGND